MNELDPSLKKEIMVTASNLSKAVGLPVNRVDGWLDLVRTMWPECPASIDNDGTGLFVDRANAVLPTATIGLDSLTGATIR
jgi:hypothetical protein